MLHSTAEHVWKKHEMSREAVHFYTQLGQIVLSADKCERCGLILAAVGFGLHATPVVVNVGHDERFLRRNDGSNSVCKGARCGSDDGHD